MQSFTIEQRRMRRPWLLDYALIMGQHAWLRMSPHTAPPVPGACARFARCCIITAGIGAAALVSACASLAGDGAPSGETNEARAERVFRYQSRLADALLDRYPLREQLADADPRLVAAEARMTESCGSLTRAVVENLEGREPSVELKLAVWNSLDDCERAAQTIERMIEKLDGAMLTAGQSPDGERPARQAVH